MRPQIVSAFLAVFSAIGIFTITGCGGGSAPSTGGSGGGGGGGTGGDSNPVPVLTSVSPNQAHAGSAPVTITLTGSNFISSSTAEWNGNEMIATSRTSTSITATLPSAALAAQGTVTVTVVNPSPGGGASPGVSFTVEPATLTTAAIPVIANDIVWDPVSQLIYLSAVGSTMTTGTAVQSLDPATGKLGTPVSVSSDPDRLAVSASSKYLYVGLDAGSNGPSVQVLNLPSLTPSGLPPIALGSQSIGLTTYPYIALNIEPSPNADETVAVVRGTHSVAPYEIGGIVIYDGDVPRTNRLCGDDEIPTFGSELNAGCIGANPGHGPNGYEWNSALWSPDASGIYASDGASTAADYYTIPVNSSGFGTVTTFQTQFVALPSNPRGFYSIHYDATTGYLFNDNGVVLKPADGSVVAKLGQNILANNGQFGCVIPDGKLGAVFLLWWNPITSYYELDSFDITTFAPIAEQALPNLLGAPVQMVRWGTDGLAISTLGGIFDTSPPTGGVYILQGPFIGNPKSAAN